MTETISSLDFNSIIFVFVFQQSTSSTESDSMPFANDNAGTIKQRSARTHPALAPLSYSTTHSTHSGRSPAVSRRMNSATNINAANINAANINAANIGQNHALFY